MIIGIIEFIISMAMKFLMYGGVLFAVGVVLLYFYQDSMLYAPNQPSPQMKTPEQNPEKFRSPSEYDLPFEDVVVTTPDGLKLYGWFIKQRNEPEKRETILFFQANAGNIGFRLPNIAKLYEK